jgi:hypothetical protein
MKENNGPHSEVNVLKKKGMSRVGSFERLLKSPSGTTSLARGYRPVGTTISKSKLPFHFHDHFYLHRNAESQ